MQVGTPELDEAAHYLTAKAHALKSMAERDRPDLLVEVSIRARSFQMCLLLLLCCFCERLQAALSLKHWRWDLEWGIKQPISRCLQREPNLVLKRSK